jgi:hypothetical protein
MRNSNTIGVDLAKNVIQVSVVTPANKELSNKALSRIKFAEFLAKQTLGSHPSNTVVVGKRMSSVSRGM